VDLSEGGLDLKLVDYAQLTSRQQETYNFQKVSAVLADYGYRTIRLSEDWESADFIAFHNDGSRFLKVQLKGRLSLDTKYKGKEIFICFPFGDEWYLYPHDQALEWGVKNNKIGKKGWELGSDGEPIDGSYTWPQPPKVWLAWLERFKLPARSTTGLPTLRPRGNGGT
jgi:hypothetical protein